MRLDHAVDLVLDLLFGAEDVRIVLRDVPNAEQAVQRARKLVPVQRGGFRVAQREVAIAAQLASEEEHVAGTVHRLDANCLPSSLEETKNIFSA